VQARSDVCLPAQSLGEEASLQREIPGDFPNLSNAPGECNLHMTTYTRSKAVETDTNKYRLSNAKAHSGNAG